MSIEFPNINPVIMDIYGPLAIRWYSLAYIIGLILGFYYIKHLAKKFMPNLKNEFFDSLLTYVTLGIVIGGRIGYVLFYDFAYIANNPLQAIKIWDGGMSFHGGLVGVVISCIILAYKYKIPLFTILDYLAAATPIGLFLGRIANFINGELYGRVTNRSWGVIFPHAGDLPRHPSQIYEAFFEGIVIFFILALLIYKKKILQTKGTATGIFCLLYGSFRIFLEQYREPDPHIGFIFANFTLGQILSLPLLALGVMFIFKLVKINP